MKWLVVALLLANIAFLGWNYWEEYYVGREDAAARMPDAPIAGGDRLVLVGEKGEPRPIDDRRAKPSATPEQEDRSAGGGNAGGSGSASAQPSRRCFRIGGLEDERAVGALKAQLADLGIEPVSTGTAQENETRYWVLLAPAASRKAAQSSIARLKRKGFSDYYLVKSGEKTNAVSLGVFSEKSGAERRMRRIRKYGFEPRMEAIDYPVERRWVEVAWTRAENFPGSRLGVTQDRLQATNCSN